MKDAEMVSEGEELFILVDGRKALKRDEHGKWTAFEDGWTIHPVTFTARKRREAKPRLLEGFEFRYDDEPLEYVFFEDSPCLPDWGNARFVRRDSTIKIAEA